MSDIINCYHQEFSGGIGDFIKGSIYLYSRCLKYGLDIDMDWKYHPIGKFISSNCKEEYDTKYIIDIEDLQFNKIPGLAYYWIDRIIENVAEDMSYRPATVSSWYGTIDMCQDKIEYLKTLRIGNRCKNFIKRKICFSKKIDELWKSRRIYDYGIIHFRLGDRHVLPDLEKKIDKYEQVIKENYNTQKFDHDYEYYLYLIKKNKREKNLNRILVLSDSNDFKRFIQEETRHDNTIIVTHLMSAHTASKPGLLKYTDFQKEVTTEQYKHTALDFKYLTKSLVNITYSYYGWGSGFVVWPSKLYDIPVEINVLK